MNCEVKLLINLFVNVDGMYGEIEIWNLDICYSEDDFVVYVKYFIVDCI